MLVGMGVVNRERVPGFVSLVAHDAGMGEIKVSFRVSLHLCLVVHGFATALAHVLALALHSAPGYHPIQNRVQVWRNGVNQLKPRNVFFSKIMSGSFI